MEIVYVYQKIRGEFGKHIVNKDRASQVDFELPPRPEEQEAYMEKNPCTFDMDCVPMLSEHAANTEITVFADKGMYHEEGGWPRDVDASEPEQKQRYLKKAEKDEDYVKSMDVQTGGIIHAMRQNSAIDIYEDYFENEKNEFEMAAPSYRTTCLFKDPSPFKRCATSVSWRPDRSDKLAVSYSILGFQASPEGLSCTSFIWDIDNPNYPLQSLEPPSALCCLEYNPKDVQCLIGGSYNGMVACWDMRAGETPTSASKIEKSHRDPVYSIAYLQSKTGTDCASVSTDGRVLFWDTRNLAEPYEEMELMPKSFAGGQDCLLGGCSLEYSAGGGPTKFMVGTEQGMVLSCNRKAKTAADQITGAYLGHHGPIYAIERNPMFPKFFLTVGDWTARIWFEDVKTCIMCTQYNENYLTSGCWSPTRPGVFFTTKDNGEMDVWDFAFKQNAPTLPGIKVSDAALQSISPEINGRLLGVGDAGGSVTVISISEGLAEPQLGEKQAIMQMFEREQKREKNLEARAKELKIKAKKDASARAEAQNETEHDCTGSMPELEVAFYSNCGIEGMTPDAPPATEEAAPAPAPAPAPVTEPDPAPEAEAEADAAPEAEAEA